MIIAKRYNSGLVNVASPIKKGSSLDECCDSIVEEFLLCSSDSGNSISHKPKSQKYAGLILFNCQDISLMEQLRTKINETFKIYPSEHLKILEFPNNHEVSMIFGEERYMGVDVGELINRGYLQYTFSRQV
ncbi:MAG: hypothetical protein AABW91_02950 [Nanoarchaeota archaeon]